MTQNQTLAVLRELHHALTGEGKISASSTELMDKYYIEYITISGLIGGKGDISLPPYYCTGCHNENGKAFIIKDGKDKLTIIYSNSSGNIKDDPYSLSILYKKSETPLTCKEIYYRQIDQDPKTEWVKSDLSELLPIIGMLIPEENQHAS